MANLGPCVHSYTGIKWSKIAQTRLKLVGKSYYENEEGYHSLVNNFNCGQFGLRPHSYIGLKWSKIAQTKLKFARKADFKSDITVWYISSIVAE